GRRALWVAEHDAGAVEEIDLASMQSVATIAVGNGPSAVALGAGGLWVADSLDSTVARIDPERAIVTAAVPVCSWPAALTIEREAVWVACEYGNAVARVDPRTNQVVDTVDVAGPPTAVVASARRVWAGQGPAGGAHRGGTLVLASSGSSGSVDPAVYAAAPSSTFTDLAYDSLVRFALTSGPDGLRLVPDLALRVPTASADGRSYRFRLRAGIRYSDGEELHAGDFRRALERVFRLRSAGVSDFTALIGAAACTRRPASCSLADGVVTDDNAGTVTFHLVRPDPDFLFKLADYGFAAPVPPGTPSRDMRLQPIAG